MPNPHIPPTRFCRVNAWKKEYPSIYASGWGPTTKAERWNGRHAMFGWIALLFTGYAKTHGLIPNPDTLLDTKEWGTLAYLYGGSITNERAIIIVGASDLIYFNFLNRSFSSPLRSCRPLAPAAVLHLRGCGAPIWPGQALPGEGDTASTRTRRTMHH